MTRYRFGKHELDAATGELRGPDGTRRLEPQPARALELLVTRAGELVPRGELEDELWGDAHVDRGQGLAYCLRQIRSALGDEAAAPRFVETLPRRGYRFLLPVETVAEPSEAGDHAERRPAPVAPRSRGRIGTALLLLLVVLGSAAALRPLWSLFPSDGPSDSHAAPVRLAVFPLAPASEAGNPGSPTPLDREVTRALVAALTLRGEGTVDVVGPATTGALDRSRGSQPELGRELGVELLVSGGTSDDGTVVFLQLLRSDDGAHLWARRLPAGPPEALADEAAREILARASRE